MNPLIKIPEELIRPLFKPILEGVTATTPIVSMATHKELLVNPASVGAVAGEVYCLFFIASFYGHDWRALVPIARAGEDRFFLSIPSGWCYQFFFEQIEGREETPEQFIERVHP